MDRPAPPRSPKPFISSALTTEPVAGGTIVTIEINQEQPDPEEKVETTETTETETETTEKTEVTEKPADEDE